MSTEANTSHQDALDGVCKAPLTKPNFIWRQRQAGYVKEGGTPQNPAPVWNREALANLPEAVLRDLRDKALYHQLS